MTEWIQAEPDLCLEFANTLEWQASDQPEETLHTYTDLVLWWKAAGLVDEADEARLLHAADDRPDLAETALAMARDLRKTIYRIFSSVAAGAQPAETDLAKLNQALAEAMRGGRIERSPEGFIWRWGAMGDELVSPLGPIARSAGALLTSEMRKRVGRCADDRGCGYLFLDLSKNHSRRWCNMGDCGNRAKQRRYHRRQAAKG